MTFKLAATAILALGVAALSPPASAATNDACSLLALTDVAAALGSPVAAGEPTAAADLSVCTWKSADGHSRVTLTLQTLGAFDSGKNLSNVAKSVVLTPVSGLGDGAYYLAVSDRVGLVVKKGASAFNVSVSQQGSLDSRQTAERTLAEKIVPRL